MLKCISILLEMLFSDLNKQRVTDIFVTVRKVMACFVRNENLYIFLHLVKEFPKNEGQPVSCMAFSRKSYKQAIAITDHSFSHDTYTIGMLEMKSFMEYSSVS